MLTRFASLGFFAALCAMPVERVSAAEPEGPVEKVAPQETDRELNARIAKLILQLGDDRFEAREAATKALREIGNLARVPLERALKSDDAEVVSRAKGLLDILPKLTHTIHDALGAPLPLATVVVTFTRAPLPPGRAPMGEVPKPATSISDPLGRVAIPEFTEGEITASVRISNADYGSARCDLRGQEKVLRVPLVRQGTEARERALVGQVVTPDGSPVANAELTCGHVRTPGQGLLNIVQPPGVVLTDADGRFACYAPSVELDREPGKLIPPNSQYALTISVPGDDSYFPVVGHYGNLAPVRIEVPRATRLHRLRVTAVGGGFIETPEQLRFVQVQYVREKGGEVWLVPLEPLSLVTGRKLIPGTYQAQSYVGGKVMRYLPLVVTADSPEELVLQPPPAATFRGRLVHGITGEPRAKAFVMGWNSTSHNNLAMLTADDWKLLRETSSPAKLDDPAVRRLANFYGVQGLVRTDDQGRFEITRQPDQEFYGLLAFDEHFVPYKARVGGQKQSEDKSFPMGDLPLFPAAKVLVRPVFDGPQLSISPKWLPTADGQPDWYERFVAAGKGWENEFEYVHWLKLNEPQPIFVPAGIRLNLRIDSPYNDAWAPLLIDAPFQLAPEATHELGDIRLAASFAVVVRVIDKEGKPVEGIPLRRKHEDAWGLAQNTDKEGQAKFHVYPKSKGEFRVVDFPGGPTNPLAANLVVPYEATDKPPPQIFEIMIGDEPLKVLRGIK